MAYFTGTATSPAALLTALLTHAQADGWVLTGEVLSKNGVYFRIQLSVNNITVLGCESNAVDNPAPNVVRIGDFYGSPVTYTIGYPATYHFFGFGQEAYFVVNYDTAFYQWLAFGKSTVTSLPGQGGWCGGSRSGTGLYSSYGPVNMAVNGFTTVFSDNYAGSPAMFWPASNYYLGLRNAWVNHNLDGYGWLYDTAVNSQAVVGIGNLVPLLSQQPSAWNGEAALLPIRAHSKRPSYRISLIADLEHARNVRIDNVSPGEVLTLGTDKWMVFPWYAKNAAERDCGSGKNHSGTFGWAIRYEGP